MVHSKLKVLHIQQLSELHGVKLVVFSLLFKQGS